MSTKQTLSGRARLFLTGMFVTNVGNGMYVLAAGQLLYQHTHSVLGYALVLVSEFAFKLLLQGVNGVERVPAVVICMISDIVRCLAVLGAFALLVAGSPIAAIALSALAINFFKPFYISASFRLAGQLNQAHQLERYNAAFVAVKQSGYLLGIALFGLFVTTVGASWVLLANAASYALMLGLLALVRDAEPLARPRGLTLRGGWLPTLRLARDRSLAKAAVAASVDPIMLYFVSLVVLPMSQTWYAGHGSTLAWLQGACVLGTAASVLVVRETTGLGPRAQSTRWLSLLGVQAVALVVVDAWRELPVAVVGIFVLGLANATSFSYHMARLMRWKSEYEKGRIASLQLLATSTLMGVSLPVLATLTDTSVTLSFGYPLLLILGFAILLRSIVRDELAAPEPVRTARG